MMGGMGTGLVMLLAFIMIIVEVGLFVLSQKRSETTAKRKNDEVNSDDEGFSIGDDGEIVEYPETKFKRKG